MAEIPKISYEGSPRVDRAKLPGHDHEPTVEVYDFDGERQEHLSWPSVSGGSSSASPVHRRAFGEGPEAVSREDLLWWIEETLEQPGELSDYHFAIQSFCEAAYKRRQEDPAVLADVERFCFVDIELVENYPETIEYEPGKFYRVLAFDRLVSLYEREGYLREALEVAERGLACGQELARKVEELRERVAALEAEDAG
jgi:hypothetical protein